MNCIVCDECGKRTTVDPVFQRRPSGWITVSQVDSKGDREDGDYCSAACAVIKLTEHLTTTQRPLLVKPPLPESWQRFVTEPEAVKP